MGQNAKIAASAFGASLAAGVASGLAQRRAALGPAWWLTALHLLGAFMMVQFIPFLGAIWGAYGATRIARRIGATSGVVPTANDTRKFAWATKVIWVPVSFIVFGLVVQGTATNGDYSGAGIIFLLVAFAGVVGVAIWNGSQINKILRVAIAEA